MKYLFILIFLFGLVGSVQALDNCYSGSWYDSTTSDGRGIDIQVLDSGLVTGYFYTWHSERRELFLLTTNPDAKKDEAFVQLDGWQSLVAGTSLVGEARLEAGENGTLIFSHSWVNDMHNTANTMRWCVTGCDAVYTYQRLTQPVTLPCNSN